MSRLHEGPLWLLGAGNMGGAMLRGWLDAGLDPASVTVIHKGGRALPPGVVGVTAPPDGAVPATLMLGVKPQMIDQVAPMIAPVLRPETVLISILAGVEVASLRRRFPAVRTVVRVMPNTPVALGKGVLLVHADGPVDRVAIETLLRPLGLAEWIADEALFDAVTALCGCGPAFLFRFIDAMAKAGEALGIAKDQAARLALATIEGAGALAAQAGETPAALADKVASPGGSTRAGLNRLDRDGDLDRLLQETLAAAEKRNAEMAAAAR